MYNSTREHLRSAEQMNQEVTLYVSTQNGVRVETLVWEVIDRATQCMGGLPVYGDWDPRRQLLIDDATGTRFSLAGKTVVL